MPCPDCGADVSLRARACPHCGAPFSSGKSRGVAVVLALLLGGVGAHKFYLDRPGTGVLYLLFCWTFIPAVLGLLEGLYYLTLSSDAFDDMAMR